MEQMTITTIAKQAGVSAATVSRVINNPALVSQETRRRVTQVIQEHNFQICKEAQLRRLSKRSIRTGRIGFLVPMIPHRPSETITEEMRNGIQRVLSARGMELVVHSFSPNSTSSSSMPKMLLENSVDGLLIRPLHDFSPLLEFCRNRKAVLLGSTLVHTPGDIHLPCVIPDDWMGMGMVMKYLFELGHRRIGFVSGPLDTILNLRRLQAYRFSLEERGISYDERLVKIHDTSMIPSEEMSSICRRFLNELLELDSPLTAIATAGDAFAVGFLRVARESGLKVPDDLSICGYGDHFYASVAEPPLTTVHVDHETIGEIGAHQLLQWIEGRNISIQSLVLPSFVERRSCAAFH